MENFSKQFINSPTEQNGYNLLHNLRINKFHNTAILLGGYISKMYPHSVLIRSENAISAYYSKRYNLSYDLYSKNLSNPNLCEKESFFLRFNQHFSIPYVSDRYTNYPKDIIKNISQRSKNHIPLVTFTITTCKRFELFEKTMNSFLNCCKDIDRIDVWFCVDDNSSEEDRKKMKEKYPFFTFYWKTFEEKGHPRSMNIIRDFVKTEYVFHMEDDWKYFSRKNYISDCMAVLGDNEIIGQCLININYSEISDDIDIVGGEFNKTKGGVRYYIHEHTNTKEERDTFTEKHGKNKKNCAYWPHFSFRPSLFRRNILSILGEFNQNISHFEMDYGFRYTGAGLKSAFLEGIYCMHIGRLTSDRNNKTIPNAYDLNDEVQFPVK